MDYVTLGRTGLHASVVGLGCGGPSRLGLRYGNSEREAVAVVHTALDLGINLLDTAESYQTETIVAQAVKAIGREKVIISSKKNIRRGDDLLSAHEYVDGVHQSLRRLGTDYIDIFHLHALRPQNYDYARNEIVPAMERLREEGQIRFIGVTEAFERDFDHTMVQQAFGDTCWDLMMIGFNMLNQSARAKVFPQTQARRIGTLVMFAVRRAFSDTERLGEILAGLAEEGRIDQAVAASDRPLGFLLEEGGAQTLAEVAYRFCRHEPGVDVVLSGTGSCDHLRENVASLLKPPLPAESVQKLNALFAKVDNISGS